MIFEEVRESLFPSLVRVLKTTEEFIGFSHTGVV
jgi:hypothetical protein